MSHSTLGPKPAKPRPDFPLFPHASGRWAKKVKGRLRYFGPWRDPEGALARWLDQKDDLLAGREPPTHDDGELTVRGLLNRYLTAKRRAVDLGEITVRTFRDYRKSCERIADTLGLTTAVADLRPDDFERLSARLAETMGPVTRLVEIRRSKVVFKWAVDMGLIDRPVNFGPQFKGPPTRVLREHRQRNGEKLFEPDEIRRMIATAGPQLKAMILLGANAGFGNTDCATLTRERFDLEMGWVSHPRPKTQIPRRAPLWPETIGALRKVEGVRPKPGESEHADLVFITSAGNPWVRIRDNSTPDAVQLAFRRLLKKLDIEPRGRGFYTLRHVFETVAGDSRDQLATDAVMGHADPTMAGVYRERVDDDRLRAVVAHVRQWLFGRGGV